MLNKPADVMNSGQVRRWHTHHILAASDETLAQHQWLTTVIVLHMRPDASRALILASMFHDVGEYAAGDLGHPFKQSHPEIADAHRTVEGQYRDMMLDYPDLSDDERHVMGMADWFAGWAHMLRFAPQLRAANDWQVTVRRKLQSMSEDDRERMVDLMTAYRTGLGL